MNNDVTLTLRVLPAAIIDPNMRTLIDPNMRTLVDPNIRAKSERKAGGVADDTAGHALTQGGTPATSGQTWQLAPGIALRLTLPDPPAGDPTHDVQGFRNMETQTLNDRGGTGTGGSAAPISLLFEFIANPGGTFIKYL